jgi:hypothetical protein
MNVIQTVLDRRDIATESALIMFIRFLGSAIFLEVAESIFLSRLTTELTNLRSLSDGAVRSRGVIEQRTLITGNDLTVLLSDHNIVIVAVFTLVVGMTGAAVFASLFVECEGSKSRAAEKQQDF